MNVLFVVPYVPSLVRTRSYNLIRTLSARGHQLTLATVWSDRKDLALLEALRPFCHAVEAVHVPAWRSLVNCALAVPGSEPLQARYSWSPALADRIAALKAETDVLHVEHLRGVRYAMGARTAGPARPIVWDSVDCIAYLFEQAVHARSDMAGRILNRFELSRTRGYEAHAARLFDRVLITSELDRDALLSAAPVPPVPADVPEVTVVPNGVDTRYFSPSSDERLPRTLVFSGKMSYHANVAAARHLIADVMPPIWSRMPDVELVIVGQNPPRSLRDLAAAHGSRVTVTGTVPDVRPYLREAALAVIPLVYGAGSQFKVLEAMACGTPVVATSRAVAALAAAPGRDLLVADGTDAFGAAVVQLLQHDARATAIGRAGRAYVEAHHQWDRIATRVESVYEEVVATRSLRPPARIAG